jgi:hypothetical protein
MTSVHSLTVLDAVTAAAEVPAMTIPSGICFLLILSEAADQIRTTAALQDRLEDLREGLPAHQVRTVATDHRAAMAAAPALMAAVPGQTVIAMAERDRDSTRTSAGRTFSICEASCSSMLIGRHQILALYLFNSHLSSIDTHALSQAFHIR